MEHSEDTYSIKEIANLIDEEQHVIRYWEREFSQLHPKKNISGNRIYSKKDLALLQYLKTLIREERLTILETKARLATLSFNNDNLTYNDGTSQDLSKESIEDQLATIITELNAIVNLLRS
jgi:DNA-binding transcriptional MerR regulator